MRMNRRRSQEGETGNAREECKTELASLKVEHSAALAKLAFLEKENQRLLAALQKSESGSGTDSSVVSLLEREISRLKHKLEDEQEANLHLIEIIKDLKTNHMTIDTIHPEKTAPEPRTRHRTEEFRSNSKLRNQAKKTDFRRFSERHKQAIEKMQKQSWAVRLRINTRYSPGSEGIIQAFQLTPPPRVLEEDLTSHFADEFPVENELE